MTELSRDAIVRGLMETGTTRANAERLAELEMQRRGAGRSGFALPSGDVIEEPSINPLPEMQWPMRLTLPWTYLVSDNDRHGAVIVPLPGGKLIPKLILDARYREAKTKIRALARLTANGAEPVNIPLRLHARVWVPDRKRVYDVVNFAKGTHDALSKAIYVDDQWLHDARWTRAGVDVDRPRAEITITPITGRPNE